MFNCLLLLSYWSILYVEFLIFVCVCRHLLISDVLLSKGAKGSSFHMHRKESILLRCVLCSLS